MVAPAKNHFDIRFNPAVFYRNLISDELLAYFDGLWEKTRKAAETQGAASDGLLRITGRDI